MLDSEVEEIQERTGKRRDEFCIEIFDKLPYRFEMKKAQDGKCVFLKPEGCNIYGFRPMVCRFYPFELKFDEAQQKHVFSATTECPALNQGKHLTLADFKRLFWLAQEKLP
jgi:Fe-S-cluster containining protein